MSAVSIRRGAADAPVWSDCLARFLSWHLAAVVCAPLFAGQDFNFKREFFGPPSSLTASIQITDSAARRVALNGGDTRQPTTPFTVEWGDGQTSLGFFGALFHQYGELRNYIVRVTAHYGSGHTDSIDVPVLLTPPTIRPVATPAGFEVTFATSLPRPISRNSYGVPPSILPWSAADFGVVPQASAEYVLTLLAMIQRDFLAGQTGLIGNGFRQQIWKDENNGFYSLWFTNPVSLTAGKEFRGSLPWSSIAHEIGHNLTLNFPPTYPFGGNTDGNSSAFFSETMAQIFQHAAIYELARNAESYGLSDDLVSDLIRDARGTANVLRRVSDQYVSEGKRFSAWNDAATAADEAAPSFMTLAFQFLSKVEQDDRGYRAPVTRLATFLSRFNPDWNRRWASRENTSEAATFRSTLMVAAISSGVGRDLRRDFRDLNFPIDDATFDSLSRELPPVITGAPDSLEFVYTLGGPAPAARIVTLTTIPSGQTITSAAATETGKWLSAVVSGTTLTVSIDVSGLAAGTHNGSLRLSVPGVANAVIVPVVLRIQAPLVRISRVVNAASGSPAIHSGSWASIYGENLSASTRTWRSSDFKDDLLPLELDGVSVTINGRGAAVYFISPNQLNVQAPGDPTLGEVAVQVKAPLGSASATANLQAHSPAFFAQGKYVAAVHATDGAYVAPSGSLGPAPARGAEPGEIILLYGTGFGQTVPPASAGQIFTGAAPLADPSKLRITIGGTRAIVQFAGLVAAGQYQMNVVVPDIPDGDQPIVASIDGSSTQGDLFLPVQRASR